MSGNADKTKFSIRVDTQLVELADAYIKEGLQRNRTELIEEALRFYLGFLTAKKAEDYLLQSLSSVMSGTMQDSENRLVRMDFKIAVELSKLTHVIAYTHDVDEAALGKLHLKCLEEVRHINGAVEFERGLKCWSKLDWQISGKRSGSMQHGRLRSLAGWRSVRWIMITKNIML